MMKITRFRGRESGFTLIELLIVVILISILGAIVIPRYMINQKLARIQACEIQRALINKSVENFFLVESTWPLDSLSDIKTNMNYFPDGIPTCPVDLTSYQIIPSPIKRVTGHREGAGTHWVKAVRGSPRNYVCSVNADCSDGNPATGDECYCGGTGGAFCWNPPRPCFDPILLVNYNCNDGNPNTLDNCGAGVGACFFTPVACP